MHPALRRARVAALITSMMFAGSLLPLLSGAAGAAEPFTDTGTIATSRAFGLSTTETEWQLTCPELPDSQGEDAWIFTLPDGFDVTGTTTQLTGSAEGSYDLDLVFWDSECGFIDVVGTDDPDEKAPTPAGTKWVEALAFSGSNITVDLLVGGTAEPSPTPTDPQTEPPPVSRGSYPAQPNDPFFPEQNAILGGQWGIRKIQAPEAWQEEQATGFGVEVAVLDTGLDLDHEDLQCPGKINVIPNSDFVGDGGGVEDGDGHGTHVSGIVGACTNNEMGVAGVAPDATVMPIQVLDEEGEGSVLDVAPAIRAATDAGAHVVNISIGTLEVNSVIDVLTGGVFEEVDAAIDYAIANGVVVVAAAGNESLPICTYPAIYEDIVCVGSSDNRDLNSWFGNFPIKDDDEDTIGPGVLAPGGSGQVFCDFHAENILSTYPAEKDGCDEGMAGYRGLDGTSMASPHVSGVAALVYDRFGGVRSEENGRAVVEAIISSADDLYAPGYDPASGYGRVNALNAVLSVPPSGGEPSPSPSPTETPLQSTSVDFVGDVPDSGQYTDDVTLSAVLTDQEGTPIGDEPLTFQLLGPNGFREENATTNEAGGASVDLLLDAAPGDYTLAVAYSGKTNTYDGSTDSRDFVIEREDSGADLTVNGKGKKRTLIATLTDADDDSYPIAFVPVAFYADGQKIGDAVTDSDGNATMNPPPGARGAKTTYEVRFAGNDFFLASSARSD